jgi:PAS domain S-box-containing protein
MEESTGPEAGAGKGPEAGASEESSTEAGVTAPVGEFDRPQLAAVADRLPSSVAVFDDEGVIRYVNAALASQFGYDRSTLVGADLTALCPALSPSAVESHCSDASDEPLIAHGELADGTARTFDLSVERWPADDGNRYVATLRDVTDRQERFRELEQYERIVETIDDGVYILDDAFNIISVNDAVTDLTGYDESELVGSNVSLLATEETIQQAAAVSEALLSGEGAAASLTTTLNTADGGELPVETRFSVYPFGDGSYGQVGVVRDITDRIRHEQTLTALHDATRQLLHTETPEEVAQLIANTATEVVGLSAAAVYRFDDEASVLRPAATPGADSLADAPPAGTDSDLWTCYVDGERRVDRSGPPLSVGGAELAAEAGTYIPLGDHGVFFVAVDDADQFDADTAELIDILAASAEAGLDRVDREHRLRERDRELREQNEELRRLEAINGVIRRIDQALIAADTPEAVTAAVCEELVQSDLVSFAWIGRPDGDRVVPEAWAGEAPQYLDAVDLALAGGGSPPAVETAVDGEATVHPSVATDFRGEPWRREALSRGLRSAISVPLAPDGASYGVLTVYTGRPEGFDETLQSVFLELGETVANALRVVETKQWLSADSVVEVDLSLSAPESPLTALAAETGATLVHEGTLPGGDLTRTFCSVEGADLEAVREAADRQVVIEGIDHRSDSIEDPLVVLHCSVATVPVTVGEQGGRVQSMTVTPGGIAATVELAPTADVRAFVDALETEHGPASLDARRDRTTPAGNRGRFRAEARERLTDRQWEVLRAAHLSGFFGWPRSTTGEEIADTFDLSQPTINRHLRVGERKLFDLLFDDSE